MPGGCSSSSSSSSANLLLGMGWSGVAPSRVAVSTERFCGAQPLCNARGMQERFSLLRSSAEGWCPTPRRGGGTAPAVPTPHSAAISKCARTHAQHTPTHDHARPRTPTHAYARPRPRTLTRTRARSTDGPDGRHADTLDARTHSFSGNTQSRDAYTRRTYTQLKQNHGAEGRGAHLLIRPQPEPEQIFHAPAVSLPALRTLRH